jgi:hypothetical protein
MNAFPSKSLSDNRKSAIQNPKWVGIFAIALTFVFGGVEAQVQQLKKVPRIGYLVLRFKIALTYHAANGLPVYVH